MYNLIRTAVSGRRNRYRDGEHDLDLTYITPRLVAMAYPSDGLEAVYRNDIRDVAAFLDKTHRDRYMIFNLSERHYDNSLFGDRVVELGFPDHHSPPVEVAWTLCLTMDAWLSASPDHIAAVHCLAGKGRTGVICACYLLFSGYFFQKPPGLVGAGAPAPAPAKRALPAPASSSSSSSSSAASAASKAKDAGVNPFDAPAPASASTPRPSGAGAASSSTAAAAAAGAAPSHPLFPLPPPHELARLALAHFRTRRGEGVKYASQERTVRYFARVLHDAIVAQHEALERAEAEAAARAAGIDPLAEPSSSSPSSPPGSAPFAGQSGGWDGSRSSGGPAALTVWVRWEAARRLRSIRQLPLPTLVTIRVTKVVLTGVPVIPGGFAPVLTLTTAPYQGAETRVLYSSAWHNPSPPLYAPEDRVIVFALRAEMRGDVLFTLRHALDGREVLRFALHSTFLASEGVKGVCRLSKADVDMEKRSKNERVLPDDFSLELVYHVAAEGVPKEGGGEGGGGGGGGRRASTDVVPEARGSVSSSGSRGGAAADTSAPTGGAGAAFSPSPSTSPSPSPTTARGPASGARASSASSVSVDSIPTGGRRSSMSAAGASSSAGRKSSVAGWGGPGVDGGIAGDRDGGSPTPFVPRPEVPLQSAEGYDADILCSGWLVKRGAFVKSWKKRWFVLRRSALAGVVVADADDDEGEAWDGGGDGAPVSASAPLASSSSGRRASLSYSGAGSSGGASPSSPTSPSPSPTASSSSSSSSPSRPAPLLYYYRGPRDPAPKGVVRLSMARVRALDPSRSEKDATRAGGREWCFVVERPAPGAVLADGTGTGGATVGGTPVLKRTYLQAPEEAELARWLAALEVATTG
jgi:hypothetical protein